MIQLCVLGAGVGGETVQIINVFLLSNQPRAPGPRLASLSIHEDIWIRKLKGKDWELVGLGMLMPTGLSCHPPFHPLLPFASNLIDLKMCFLQLGHYQ